MDSKSNQPTENSKGVERGASEPQDEANSVENGGVVVAWDAQDGAKLTAGRAHRQRARRKPAWLESLAAFADDVSVVGIRYVANPAASTIRRSAWLLLILVGAGFTIFQIENRSPHPTVSCELYP